MVEMDGGGQSSSKPPQQISDMFQKFALAFKAKTYELFAEDPATAESGCDVTHLLDSAEEFIPDQKVVVIRPDAGDPAGLFLRSLIPSLFATVSAFEAAYLQFQAAHVPRIDETALAQADGSIVSILQKLNEMKNLYRDSQKRSGFNGGFDFPASSFLEFQVQENQSKLRVLETIVNSLQSQIDAKDEQVHDYGKRLDQIRVGNADLSQKLATKQGNVGVEGLLTIRVFEAMLGDAVKSMRCFSKLLIDLMKTAGWDLEQVSNYVHPGANYAKKGHCRYAFLSYVCMGMFHNFDRNDFGLCNGEIVRNENGGRNGYWRQLVEHISINPMEILRKNPNCEFLKFCQSKYEGLIHPTMESSIFSNLDRKDKVLDSWKSLAVFFEAFVRMASSVWLLHKLAHAFNPTVEIFRLEKGAKFSMVHMEDVLGKCCFRDKTRPIVEFTVVPGFKVARTVIQSQVYVSNLHQSEDGMEKKHMP